MCWPPARRLAPDWLPTDCRLAACVLQPKRRTVVTVLRREEGNTAGISDVGNSVQVIVNYLSIFLCV